MRSMSYKQGTANTNSSISPAIWGDLPIEDWALGYGGMFFFDDFDNVPSLAASIITGNYNYFLSASCTIAGVATDGDTGGNVVISLDGTANHAGAIIGGGGVQAQAALRSAQAGTRLAFEARFKISSITDDVINCAVGLANPGIGVVGGLVNTTGELISTADFIGFHSLNTNGGTTGTNAKLNTEFQDSGEVKQTVQAAAKTLVAATYVKVGFKYNPSNAIPPAKRIKFFVDGVEQSSYVTDTQMAAATFPDNEALALCAFCKTGSGAAAGTFTMDWWALGQERAP